MLLLGIPLLWLIEYTREVRATLDVPEGAIRLPLTHRAGLPEKLARIGTDLGAVEADLRAGFVSDRRTGRDEDYFCLSTLRYDVFVSSQPESDSGEPLAVVTSVKPRTRPPRSEFTVSGAVTFHSPYEERICDMEVIHREVRERIRAARRARDLATRGLGSPNEQIMENARLHSGVRRYYSALLMMIDLLALRIEREEKVSVHGVLLDPSPLFPPDTFPIRLHGPADGFGIGSSVTVEADGKKAGVRVESADEGVLHLTQTDRLVLRPGTRATVTSTARFGLARHSYALNRFLQEEVVGNWDVLARMLSAPASLPALPALAPLGGFFDTELNSEQRAAVTGAVGSPHAFFIQGPPGTGKTTVITEVVRQLVARGERVLLLAPMHVAVDEVLRRLSDVDGVFPLRAGWDDSRVRPELRRFTKTEIVGEIARRARRPEDSGAFGWRTEASRLADERTRIETYAQARRAEVGAAARRDEAFHRRLHHRAEHRAAMEEAERLLSLAVTADRATAARLVRAEHDERLAREALDRLEGRATIGSRTLAWFGAGELGRSRRTHRAVCGDLEAVRHERERAAAARVEGQRRVDSLQAWDADREARDGQACAETARMAEEARHARLQALNRLEDPGMADAGDAELATRVRRNQEREWRLERYAHLEQRWFQLTGLDRTTGQHEQRGLMTKLGEQLAASANLVCCTTVGFGGDEGLRDEEFDTLIVDEASRVIDSEFLIGAKQARRWVLVGDEKQLPPYVEAKDEHFLHALSALNMADRDAVPDVHATVATLGGLWKEDEELHRFRADSVLKIAERLRLQGHWPQTYKKEFAKGHRRLRAQGADADRELLSAMRTHLVRSLFERCVIEGPPSMRQELIEQRRMIDPIAALVRDPVYGGRYISPPAERLAASGVTPLVTGQTFRRPLIFLDTSDHPRAGEELVGTGFVNPLEADLVASACRTWERELLARGEKAVTVSVLTFYRAQARAIREQLEAPGQPAFRILRFEVIDAIDRIQGQQSDLVVISFCRTRRGPLRERPGFALWLQDVRRLNVACSRARRSVMMIGHLNTLTGLRGVPEAERFYANMAAQFSPGNPSSLLLKQLEVTSP
ncbi:DEAD/DEAH box helicase [Streptosporangium sp. NPDC000509]|uniref:DEAD/DEAH box helicase n=1 Tax=Streptosporangium sp. NPDC000509 TaxID=3366186 RepID=UPI00369B4697